MIPLAIAIGDLPAAELLVMGSGLADTHTLTLSLVRERASESFRPIIHLA
jgi:hypothetical protein